MRFRSVLTMLGCLAVLGGCGPASSDGLCAAVLEFDGRSYTGHGEVTVVPPDVGDLGSGTFPPCDDGYGGGSTDTVSVRRLEGFDPAEAVVVDDDIYLADDLDPFPRQRLRPYFDPVRCATEGPFVVEGSWLGVSAMPTERDGELAPPYRITMQVRSGDDGGETYQRSNLVVRVTRDTDPHRTAAMSRSHCGSSARSLSRCTARTVTSSQTRSTRHQPYSSIFVVGRCLPASRLHVIHA